MSVSAGQPSDEEIVARIQRGERALFAVLFDRHYGRLERFVRHLGVPEADLEDVLAEVFTRALERIQSFRVDGRSRYLAYLYSIARNLVTDRMRRAARLPQTELLPDDPAHAHDDGARAPVDVVVERERVALIRSALERLNPSDRMIIWLSYDRELSCREIMEILGKPSISAVTTHLYKAMRRLRAMVQASDPESFRDPIARCGVRDD